MTSLSRFTLALALAIAIASACSTAWAQGTPADEAAIRDIFRKFEKLYAECDSKAIVAHFSADGVRFSGGIPARGHAELEKQYDAQCPFLRGENRFDIAVSFPDADTANVTGLWTNVTTAAKAKFTVIARRESGRWLIVYGRPES